MSSDWEVATTRRIGEQVRKLRGKRSAQQVSDRTKDLGYHVGRATISELETGRRKSIPVTDLVILAAALGVPPVSLIYPDIPDGPVEVLPGHSVSSSDAMQWFDGDRTLTQDSGVEIDYAARELLDAVKERQRLLWNRFGMIVSPSPSDADGQQAYARIVEQIDRRLKTLESRIRELGGIVGD